MKLKNRGHTSEGLFIQISKKPHSFITDLLRWEDMFMYTHIYTEREWGGGKKERKREKERDSVNSVTLENLD